MVFVWSPINRLTIFYIAMGTFCNNWHLHALILSLITGTILLRKVWLLFRFISGLHILITVLYWDWDSHALFIFCHVRIAIIYLLAIFLVVWLLLFDVQTAVVTSTEVMGLIFWIVIMNYCSIIVIGSKTAISASYPHAIDESMTAFMLVYI